MIPTNQIRVGEYSNIIKTTFRFKFRFISCFKTTWTHKNIETKKKAVN